MAKGLEEAPAKPHYHGHRERLRKRFRDGGRDAMPDYEFLEMALFAAVPRQDTKELAKALLAKFGTIAEVVNASPERLKEVKGVGERVVTEILFLRATVTRVMRSEILKRETLSSWSKVLDYCRASSAYAESEQFRNLFLDKKNQLIADEVQQQGTVDHTPVYPREVIKRSLQLSASAIILVHNHPSGDPAQSAADIEMTRKIIEAGKQINLLLHDHIIVGRNGHASFRALKLI